MPYPMSALSLYRGNIAKDCINLLKEDYEWICHSLKSRGFIFIIAFITLMSMSLFKMVVFIFTQLSKPKMTYKHLNLERGMYDDSVTDIVTRREAIDEVQNHDNLCTKDKVKNQRVESINNLRGYLYQHDLTLNAQVIKSIEHRCTQEELLEMYRLGKYTKALTTTYVTFGDDINILLKEVLGNKIDLKQDKYGYKTCVKIVNDEYIPLKEELKSIYNEPIKLILDVATER